jgi:hypothetical protein
MQVIISKEVSNLSIHVGTLGEHLLVQSNDAEDCSNNQKISLEEISQVKIQVIHVTLWLDVVLVNGHLFEILVFVL